MYAVDSKSQGQADNYKVSDEPPPPSRRPPNRSKLVRVIFLIVFLAVAAGIFFGVKSALKVERPVSTKVKDQEESADLVEDNSTTLSSESEIATTDDPTSQSTPIKEKEPPKRLEAIRTGVGWKLISRSTVEGNLPGTTYTFDYRANDYDDNERMLSIEREGGAKVNIAEFQLTPIFDEFVKDVKELQRQFLTTGVRDKESKKFSQQWVNLNGLKLPKKMLFREYFKVWDENEKDYVWQEGRNLLHVEFKSTEDHHFSVW